MRTALISDIHGDIEGLQIVLGDIARQDCERIMCLGDLVDGGQNHSTVIQTIREQGVLTVQGNHDEFPSVKLSQDEYDFLQNLPEQIIEDDVLFTHISPRGKTCLRIDYF